MTAAARTSGSLLATAPSHRSRAIKNTLATVFITSAFGVALVPLVWLLWTVISKGLGVILNAEWWTTSQRGITFKDSGGGAWHAMLGTAQQVLLCTVISVPIALLVGIYLVEYGTGPLAKVTSFMVDILTGIPSIVAALFIYSVFVTTLGGDRAGFLVSLALVMLMVPVIIRTTEEMLKLVPNELREASYALGVPKWKTIVKIVIPTALSGIITGVMLGIARVAGETAPLLILVGYSKNINANLFQGFQGSLPGMMYSQVGELGNRKFHFAVDRMWGAGLTLIIIVMTLNIGARLVGRRSKVSN